MLLRAVVGLCVAWCSSAVAQATHVHIETEDAPHSFRLREGSEASECNTPCDLDVMPGEYRIEQQDGEHWHDAGAPLTVTRDSSDFYVRGVHQDEGLGLALSVIGGVLALGGGAILAAGGALLGQASSDPGGLLVVLGPITSAAGIAMVVTGIVLFARERLQLRQPPPITFDADPYAGSFMFRARASF